MAFKEEGEVTYTMINGKKVPVVKCETEVVLCLVGQCTSQVADADSSQSASAHVLLFCP